MVSLEGRARVVDADQLEKERAIGLAIGMDMAMFVAFMSVSLVGGSFTLLAESIRGGLVLLLEIFSFFVLRRVHRGTLRNLDYGTGKLEQVANLVVGASMLLGATWIVIGAVRILVGQSDLGTPIGLAIAAIAGAVNAWVNLIAWDATRRAAATGDSLIMEVQLRLRRTKLFASLVILTGLTVAALSTDHLIVAWADGLGSLFVAVYLVWSTRAMLRGVLADLLDRAADRPTIEPVERALARHADDFARTRSVRSRRSGHRTFVEIALELDPSLTLGEVARRVDALEASIRAEARNVEVVIVTEPKAP